VASGTHIVPLCWRRARRGVPRVNPGWCCVLHRLPYMGWSWSAPFSDSIDSDVDMLTPTGYPPPNTAADAAHSAHSTQPSLRPHRATPRVEDKPPQMHRPHLWPSPGLCSPLSGRAQAYQWPVASDQCVVVVVAHIVPLCVRRARRAGVAHARACLRPVEILLYILSVKYYALCYNTSTLHTADTGTGTGTGYPGGTPLQKSFKIRSWVPSPQMP